MEGGVETRKAARCSPVSRRPCIGEYTFWNLLVLCSCVHGGFVQVNTILDSVICTLYTLAVYR